MNDKKEKVIYWYVKDHPDIEGVKCLIYETENTEYCSATVGRNNYDEEWGKDRIKEHEMFLKYTCPNIEYIFIEL